MTTPGGFNASAASAGGAVASLALQAATPAPGVPLVNGTPGILSWTPPNDGKLHRVTVYATMAVYVTEVGGAITNTFTDPNGDVFAYTFLPGGQAPGFNFGFYNLALVVKGGQPFTIVQTSALTAGTATLWAEIWGS